MDGIVVPSSSVRESRDHAAGAAFPAGTPARGRRSSDKETAITQRRVSMPV
jgi:hypothetical protein